MLREKGIAVSEDMDGPLKPGSVVFVETPEGVTHRDYVTHAWTAKPRQGSAGQNGGNAGADAGGDELHLASRADNPADRFARNRRIRRIILPLIEM